VSLPAAPARTFRLGPKAWLGAGAALLALAIAAYLVLADPFAGPLPDGFEKRTEAALGTTVATPASYRVIRPGKDDSDKNWVTYEDESGALWVRVSLARKSQDTSHTIEHTAPAQMYADDKTFRNDGQYDLDMPGGARTHTDDKVTYHGEQAAQNTVDYTTDDSQNPRKRELQIFYYRTESGDMYRLLISYPGEGDFTARGREVAKTAIGSLDIKKP
jgi:hypothetical protein